MKCMSNVIMVNTVNFSLVIIYALSIMHSDSHKDIFTNTLLLTLSENVLRICVTAEENTVIWFNETTATKKYLCMIFNFKCDAETCNCFMKLLLFIWIKHISYAIMQVLFVYESRYILCHRVTRQNSPDKKPTTK